MAKSIYEILSDLTTSTSVPGYGAEITHSLPSDLFPTDQQFENEESLLEWAKVNTCLHAVMQKGIQKFLIDCRAAFKSCKKNDIWNEDYGQNNVDSMKWKITKRPGENANMQALIIAELKVSLANAQAMRDNGLDDEAIIGILATNLDDDVVDAIMDKLT